jgi:phosphoglycerate dehydrogenase-like enzyme
MSQHNILVTYVPEKDERKTYEEVLGTLAPITYLNDIAPENKGPVLKAADIIVSKSFSESEIQRDEMKQAASLRFVQLIFAGADNVPFDLIPESVPVACNQGAFAGPVAEHTLALALALAKSLIPKHSLLSRGKFDQTGLNKTLKGGICGIIGLGGNGMAVANLMRAVGLQVYGVNRSGQTDFPVDYIGSTTGIRKVLAESDIVVLTVPLNRHTRNLIGPSELNLMKPDAILINVARGDIVDQKALYEHMKGNPEFRAGIDTWWSEPERHGAFKLEYPFFDLPNFLGSPHNADIVPQAMLTATRLALSNVKNYLLGYKVRGLLNREDY